MSDYVRDLLFSLIDRLCVLEAENESLRLSGANTSQSGSSASATEQLRSEVHQICLDVFGHDDR